MARLGRLTDATLLNVREQAQIERVVSDYVTLKTAGAGTYKGLCPFHDEKSPSFHVTPERGTYHCFGCQAGGDVISFLQEIEALDFIGAIERLSDRFNITLEREEGTSGARADDGPRADSATRARLIEANRAAATFFHACLGSPAAEPARTFLTERGFTAEDATTYGCGYAPNEWDQLHRHLSAMGFSDNELVLAGLVTIREDGRGTDRFRGRLIFPIQDQTGTVIGFGGRQLFDDPSGKTPKYLNTSETPLYRKSKVLYGLNRARKDIATSKRVVVVEGYTDVMACHLSGETTAVATCGTAFGEEHVRIIRRLLSDDGTGGEVIYTFDGDAAGQKAALKAFTLDHHFQTRTSVAVDPEGMDPCEVRIHRGDQGVRDLIHDRIPLFAFAINNALSKFDLTTAEGRVNALTTVGPILADIHHPELLREYMSRVARHTGATLDAVRATMKPANRDSHPLPAPAQLDPEAPVDTAAFERPSGPEHHNATMVLQVAFRDHKFVELISGEITTADFAHSAHKALWDVILQAAQTKPTSTVQWATGIAAAAQLIHPTLASIATEIAVTPTAMRHDWNYDTAQRAALMLVVESTERRLDRIHSALAAPDLPVEKMADGFNALAATQARQQAAKDRLQLIDAKLL